MEWQGRQGSSNVENVGGGGRGLATGGGVGCLGIIIAIVYMLMGGDPTDILGGGTSNQQTQQTQTNDSGQSGQTEREQFASVVLKDTETVWNKLFQDEGLTYEEPTMVLFSNAVSTGCGNAGSEMGPFYCPADEKLYIDLTFMDELDQRFQAPGDFAMAYVIAHEVGHHVQNQLGTADKVNRLRQQLSEKEFNRYSVAMELQADYYAGVYAHYEQKMGVTEEGDIEEAIKAAHAVGDDTLQEQSMGRVNTDTFTHGSSADRMKWFKKGYETGDIRGGNTFSEMGLE